MLTMEIFLHWVTVGIYILSSGVFLYGLNFKRENLFTLGVWIALAGLGVHTVALILRWLEAGHGPYLRIYEVYSSNVWVLILMFLLLQWWKPNLKVLGAFILPAAFLMIGRGVMASPEIQPLPGNFKTFWLVIHILFAKIAYGALVIGTSLAGLFLWKQRRKEASGPFLDRLPPIKVLDELSYSLIGFGFFNLTIMIVAGSIWAHTAWGNYWSWDPVETWSLISWFLYGIYLHLKRVNGWSRVKLAWFAIILFGLLLFSLFGIGMFYVSKHSPYIS